LKGQDAKLSEKIYPEEELRERVTIRVLPEKLQVYPRFKELVTKKIGSDVCFVTTSLWEAFIQAMAQVPPEPSDKIEMQFLKQNVQINIGCQFNYTPKKARRTPASKTWTGQDPSYPFYINRDKNPLLPEFLDQWDHMGDQARVFWLRKLVEKGIVPAEALTMKQGQQKTDPPISIGTRDKPLKKIFKTLKNSMTNVTDWLRRTFWEVRK
jgi:hypothetical protein